MVLDCGITTHHETPPYTSSYGPLWTMWRLFVEAYLICKPNSNLQPVLACIIRNMGGTVRVIPMEHSDGFDHCQRVFFMCDPEKRSSPLVELF